MFLIFVSAQSRRRLTLAMSSQKGARYSKGLVSSAELQSGVWIHTCSRRTCPSATTRACDWGCHATLPLTGLHKRWVSYLTLRGLYTHWYTWSIQVTVVHRTELMQPGVLGWFKKQCMWDLSPVCVLMPYWFLRLIIFAARSAVDDRILTHISTNHRVSTL
jgi:hypothetical protein